MSETNKRYVVSKDMMTALFDKTVEKEYVADAVALKQLNDKIQEIENGYVSGVKGNAESTYRKGDVNLTLDNLGYESVNNLNTTESGKLLDARQGKVLNDEIQPIKSRVSQLDFLSIVNGKLCVTYTKEV